MEITKITATQASRDFAGAVSTARREPVIITHRGEEDAILLNISRWERIKEAVLEEYRQEAELYADHMAEVARGLSLGTHPVR